MKTVLYKAETRGHANHGWLDTWHTFSFANYYDPERIHFGALRVLNDDYVEGGMGFDLHPHDNMEIVTIPLEGSIRHGDSMGNGGVIHTGDIQVMSAGTGVYHSEYNADREKRVNFFQIWVFPNKKNVTPRYEQKKLNYREAKNQLQVIVSPTPSGEGLWIHQEAWFSIGAFDKEHTENYEIKKKGNGLYAMIIEGTFEIAGQEVKDRDGIGVWETDSVEIKALTDNARILLIDVPMVF